MTAWEVLLKYTRRSVWRAYGVSSIRAANVLVVAGFVFTSYTTALSAQSAGNLIRDLTSTNVAVRADAAEALARKKDKSATPALIKALVREPVASIRGQIVAA